MNFEHNFTELELVDVVAETVDKVKETQKETKTDNDVPMANEQMNNEQSSSNSECKSSLFSRRKGPLSCKNEDELKVVIERDNMIVGFIDAIDSDATDDSQSEDETTPLRRKCLKRARSKSPKTMKKVSNKLFSFSTF